MLSHLTELEENRLLQKAVKHRSRERVRILKQRKLLKVDKKCNRKKREAAFAEAAALEGKKKKKKFESDEGSAYQTNPSTSNTEVELKGSAHLCRSDANAGFAY